MDLSVGAFGSEVALLHRGLLAAGLSVPASEQQRRFFGAETRAAVRAAQASYGLGVTGVADAPTLAAIAAAARAPSEAPAQADASGSRALTLAQVREELRSRLAGEFAGSGAASVIWTQDGSEALVHLDATAVQVAGDVLLVAVEMESAETGRGQVIVPLALAGASEDGAGMVAATSAHAFGQPQLAARWGATVQNAVWGSLIELLVERALGAEGQPAALALVDGELQLRTSGGQAG